MSPLTAAPLRRNRSSASDEAMATVNGRPIARERMVDLLVRSRGAELLEQFIVLEAADGLAAQRGLTVTDAEVQAEYDRTLNEISSPATGSQPSMFDRPAAETILKSLLIQRGFSREEYMLGMRRNALLRRLASEEQVVTEAQVRAEFVRQYGPRVRVQVVKVPALSEAPRLKEQLIAQGTAQSLMAQAPPAESPPLEAEPLAPFSVEDEDIPAIIRQTAFTLQPGQVSDVLRIENGYALLRVEERMAGQEGINFDAVRSDLEARIQERSTQRAMASMYERLFRESQLKIHDSTLKEVFEQSYPDRAP